MKIINTILLCLCTALVFGQQDYKDIHVISEFDNDKISLRWIPTSHGVWKKGLQYGYKITRRELSTGKEVVLKNALKPISASAFDSNFPNNNAAQSAKIMLYDNSMNIDPSQATTLKDAVDLKEQREGRYLFAMVAAENDFEVAEAMALGYVDERVDPMEVYVYLVEIDDDTAMASMDAGQVSPDMTSSHLDAVSTLQTSIDNEVAVLSWDIKEFEGIYTTWNIEKSYDGSNFTRINTSPFMHGYTEDEYEYLASFQDLLDDCDGEITYRVQGITPFGTEGPFSNYSKVTCVDDRLRIPLSINGSRDKGELIEINWENFQAEYQSSVQGFNLYRTPELTQPVEKLNGDLLRNTARSFVDNNPIPSAYYFLEIVDKNDDLHRSAEHFVQQFDKVAPAIPVELVGQFTSEQTITLRWDKNQESDFKGCDIAVANARKAQYIKKNKEFIADNTFSYTFNEALITDSIYVKIRSTDIYYNLSEYSEVYAFARPDVWAPTKPILEFAYPTPQGVALGWSYSGSDDVTKHRLQRRPTGSYKWQDILIVSKDKESQFGQTIATGINDSNANHLDQYNQRSIEYDYRIVAEDEARNTGKSKVLKVLPFVIPDRDVIRNFKVQLFAEQEEASDELRSELLKINSPSVADQLDAIKAESHQANVTWSCDLTEDIEGFIIYRSMTGEGFKPIKQCTPAEALGLENHTLTVSGNHGKKEFGYIDGNLKKGYRYSYYVVAKFTNGQESKRSKTITKTLK